MLKYSVRLIAVILLVCVAAPGARAESSVWLIKGPKAEIYLAGSCHVLRESDHPLPAEYYLAYSRSERVVFEAPLDEMEKPAYLQKLLLSAMYTDGSALKDHLDASVWKKAQRFCRDRNYDCDKFQMFRPWMFSLTIMMAEMSKIGIEPRYGVDQVFFRKAKDDQKSLGALETVDEQIGYLTMMDGGMDNAHVSETIDELQDLNARLAGILLAWRTGDENGIFQFSTRELKNYPKLYQKLIVDRNKRWVKEIEHEIQGTVNTMIVVGVAHLAGNESVVELLRQRGYKVEKLKAEKTKE